jgi:erythromycin esterase
MEKAIFLLSFTFLLAISCEKNEEEKTLDNLVNALNQELVPLKEDPLAWSDNDLRFLDQISDKSVIGLGEATHGTAEFFKAKHRTFKYLAENHNYKIFAIEADFGESLLINDAVQRSDTSEIENLMKTKMHFWTWKTEEVKDFLIWMCIYNLDKSEEEKVQYIGIDCQYNTFNTDIVKAYLTMTDAPFFSYAESILDEAKTAVKTSFSSYSEDTFNKYLGRIDDLQDTLAFYKKSLIEKSSEKKYQLHERILTIIRQVSEVRYFSGKQNILINYRDRYMAENVAWLPDYFDGEKVVIWAHNTHISNNRNYDSMGYHLTLSFQNEYATIGFLFSRGSFTAVGLEGEQYTGLDEHTIDVDPLENSVNFVMSHSKESVFSVKIYDLLDHLEWYEAFKNGIKFFDLGAVFNNKPVDYYKSFSTGFFDYIIYFDKSTASVLL